MKMLATCKVIGSRQDTHCHIAEGTFLLKVSLCILCVLNLKIYASSNVSVLTKHRQFIVIKEKSVSSCSFMLCIMKLCAGIDGSLVGDCSTHLK
jgi:hypothetical protein